MQNKLGTLTARTMLHCSWPSFSRVAGMHVVWRKASVYSICALTSLGVQVVQGALLHAQYCYVYMYICVCTCTCTCTRTYVYVYIRVQIYLVFVFAATRHAHVYKMRTCLLQSLLLADFTLHLSARLRKPGWAAISETCMRYMCRSKAQSWFRRSWWSHLLGKLFPRQQSWDRRTKWVWFLGVDMIRVGSHCFVEQDIDTRCVLIVFF